MTVINNKPENQEVLSTDFKAKFSIAWDAWFGQAYAILFSLQQSGTTADRPTKLIWVGRRYFDTDLTKPIWASAFSAGVVTWVDATGAVV